MSKCCLYCGKEFGLCEERYIVRMQKVKYQAREKIGESCDDCIENRKHPTFYALWNGDRFPGSVK